MDRNHLRYTPFVQILCSDDKLHWQLALTILRKNQSFVWKDDLRLALTR